jgi:hypothetical protein
VLHIESAEQAAAKATIIAERHINRFVTGLDEAQASRPAAFDASGIGTQPVNFQQDGVVRWFRAFYAHVQQNAQSADGLVHDPMQNASGRSSDRSPPPDWRPGRLAPGP